MPLLLDEVSLAEHLGHPVVDLAVSPMALLSRAFNDNLMIIIALTYNVIVEVFERDDADHEDERDERRHPRQGGYHRDELEYVIKSFWGYF